MEPARRTRILLAGRFALYVAAACLGAAVVLAVRVYQGAEPAGVLTFWSFALAVVGLLVAMPAGYAIAMAR